MARNSGIFPTISLVGAAGGSAAGAANMAPAGSEAAAELTLALVTIDPLRRGKELIPIAFLQALREQGVRPVPWPTSSGCAGSAIEEAARHSAIMLCGETAAAVLPALLRLRQQPEGALAPLGLCLTGAGTHLPPEPLVSSLWPVYADAVLLPDSLPAEAVAVACSLRRIAAALQALPPPPPLSPRGQRRLLILRLLLSRGQRNLLPRRDPGSPLAHAYPPLDLAIGPTLISDLNDLVREGLLDRTFFDRVHVCPNCEDGRLLFREVCGACLSADVRRGDVIHHYRCGHVAQEERFRQGLSLICPACSEPLRHIGIDHERPAVLLYCHNCDQLAGEGVTQARCLGCDRTHLAESIPERVLWSYHLTPEGRTAAACGRLPAYEESR
jgi:hypothetical protein